MKGNLLRKIKDEQRLPRHVFGKLMIFFYFLDIKRLMVVNERNFFLLNIHKTYLKNKMNFFLCNFLSCAISLIAY